MVRIICLICKLIWLLYLWKRSLIYGAILLDISLVCILILRHLLLIIRRINHHLSSHGIDIHRLLIIVVNLLILHRQTILSHRIELTQWRIVEHHLLHHLKLLHHQLHLILVNTTRIDDGWQMSLVLWEVGIGILRNGLKGLLT